MATTGQLLQKEQQERGQWQPLHEEGVEQQGQPLQVEGVKQKEHLQQEPLEKEQLKLEQLHQEQKQHEQESVRNNPMSVSIAKNHLVAKLIYKST